MSRLADIVAILAMMVLAMLAPGDIDTVES